VRDIGLPVTLTSGEFIAAALALKPAPDEAIARDQRHLPGLGSKIWRVPDTLSRTRKAGDVDSHSRYLPTEFRSANVANPESHD
jgi:hypothetical protein